jgi:hypothetical protein
MSEENQLVTVSFEVGANVYAVMERNAVKTQSDLADYLSLLAIADEENPAFLMELLRRTERMDEMSNLIECTYRMMESVISDVSQISSDLLNLKENFEYEFGELGDND